MENKKKLSVVNGSLLLVNSMLGAGIISLPSCFLCLGYLGAFTVLGFTSLLTLISLVFLTYSAEASQNFSYAGMCKEVGKPLAILLDVSIVLNCYGSTLCYALYIVGYLQDLLKLSFRPVISRGVIGLAIIVPLFFLAKLRSLDKLSFVSWLTLGSAILAAVELFYYAAFSDFLTKNSPVPAFNHDYARGFSPVILAMGCQQNAIPIYSELSGRNLMSSVKTMALGSIIGGVVYGAIGYLGSRLFGNFKEDDFLEIFTNEESQFIRHVKTTSDRMALFPKACVVAFISVLFCAFPIQSFAARNSLFNLWSSKLAPKKRIFITTAVQCIAVYILILLGEKPTKIISFIGTTASPMASFAFPAAIYMKNVGMRGKTFYLAAAVLVLSIFILIYGLYSLIKGPS